jgi:uncharacterized membrane protein (DUF485 family)
MREPADVIEGHKNRASLRLVRRRSQGEEAVTAEASGTDTRARASSSAAKIQEALRREWRLTISVLMFAFGIAFILLGWYGAAYTNIVSEQIPYVISGGLLGLGLIITSAIMG